MRDTEGVSAVLSRHGCCLPGGRLTGVRLVLDGGLVGMGVAHTHTVPASHIHRASSPGSLPAGVQSLTHLVRALDGPLRPPGRTPGPLVGCSACPPVETLVDAGRPCFSSLAPCVPFSLLLV